MSNIRRWYLFLVSAISLQVVTWATIALLRNLLVPRLGAGGSIVSFNAQAVAWQIAVIVIGLPLYLGHWLWAERLAGREREERSAVLRRLYLFAMLAGFLAPGVANVFDLLDTLLLSLLASDAMGSRFPDLEPGSALIYHGIALIILALLWFYHRRLAATDSRLAGEPEEGSLTVERLYRYGAGAAGLALMMIGTVSLIQWLLYQVRSEPAIGAFGTAHLSSKWARVLVGLPLWLPFWNQAQKQFEEDNRERASALRKFYLYLAVFIGVLLVTINGAVLLAGLLRRLLDVPIEADIRRALAMIIGGGFLWAYHAVVLHRDAAVMVERPRQAVVRRLYLYLVAGVGLAAFLVGLGGDISLLIRSLAAELFIGDMRRQLADFTAALLVGLPVWLFPWRKAQSAATDGPGAQQERLSQVRKIYLYFYLFAATMTVLSSAVFIVYQLVRLALGERTAYNLLVELGQAIAFTLIAVAVWLYHSAILRHDGRLAEAAEEQQAAAWRVAVVDDGDGRLGRLLLERLQQELPQLTWEPIGLTAAAAAAMETEMITAPDSVLREVDIVIGPWTMVGAGEAESQAWAAALAQSQARKLLLPVQPEGWAWVGVEPWQQEELIGQTVRALGQMIRGQAPESGRRFNPASIIAATVAALVVILILLGIAWRYIFYALS